MTDTKKISGKNFKRTNNVRHENYEPFHTIYYDDLKGADIHIHTFDSCESKIVATTHYHSYTEIIFMSKGVLTVEIANDRLKLHENEFIIIGPETMHATILEENGFSEQFIFQFKNELLETASSSPAEFFCLQKLQQLIRPFSYKHISDAENSDIIKSHMLNLHKEYYTDNSVESSLALKGELFKLLSTLYRYTDKTSEQKNENDNNFKEILKTVEYIQKHYYENISIEKMAKLANFSYHYYSRLFKALTKVNFSDYLARVRITAAEKFIAEDNLSLKETAARVGIQPQNAFSRTFKKYKGISPRQFRESFLTEKK